jgi:hypothetical protein
MQDSIKHLDSASAINSKDELLGTSLFDDTGQYMSASGVRSSSNLCNDDSELSEC